MLFSFKIWYSINLTQVDKSNNHSKETEENLNLYYLEQKNVSLVFGAGGIVVWGWERGKEAEDCSLSGFSFSASIIS